MLDDNVAPHQQIHPWLIFAFALAYISGYLIEFLYYASLGIVDAAGDILKLKYIQTGIMFLLATTLISVFASAAFLVRRMGLVLSEEGAPRPGLYPTRWSVLPALAYMFSLYISVILTPLHYAETGFQWAGIVFLIILFVGYAIVFVGTDAQYRNLYNKHKHDTPMMRADTIIYAEKKIAMEHHVQR